MPTMKVSSFFPELILSLHWRASDRDCARRTVSLSDRNHTEVLATLHKLSCTRPVQGGEKALHVVKPIPRDHCYALG